jgi:hypothetical protein
VSHELTDAAAATANTKAKAASPLLLIRKTSQMTPMQLSGAYTPVQNLYRSYTPYFERSGS